MRSLRVPVLEAMTFHSSLHQISSSSMTACRHQGEGVGCAQVEPAPVFGKETRVNSGGVACRCWFCFSDDPMTRLPPRTIQPKVTNHSITVAGQASYF